MCLSRELFGFGFGFGFCFNLLLCLTKPLPNERLEAFEGLVHPTYILVIRLLIPESNKSKIETIPPRVQL